MNFTKYTTQELEFITSNIEFLKKELEKRHIKELDDFPFKVGDVIHTRNDKDNFLIKIKEIEKRNNNVVADEIIIRANGLFGFYIDEWFDINRTEWYEYTKIEDSEIFENLLNIIGKYNDEVQQLNDDMQQLNDDTYLKLKNEIMAYDTRSRT
jgi:hypothetical protein